MQLDDLLQLWKKVVSAEICQTSLNAGVFEQRLMSFVI